jgi:hypothetical protein
MILDHNSVIQHLKQAMGVVVDQIEVVWEPCAWSQTFKIMDNKGDVFFLKGTPRSRSEARIMQLLYQYDESLVPAILHDDVLPDHLWRWFLMPDKGVADYENISQATLLQIAYRLGQLQYRARNDNDLPNLMPQCIPSQYTNIIRNIGNWLKTSFPQPPSDLIEMACSVLPKRQRFFDDIAHILADLPLTCIHGDLWSGNVAVSSKGICLLDWGDAVWGTGTTSILNLLFTVNQPLLSSDVWSAYAEGWQQRIDDEVIHASQIAASVVGLMIEQELARFDNAKMRVPAGIRPLLEELIVLSA